MSTDGSAQQRTIEQMLQRAHGFTQKLLAENARLRKSLATSHADSVQSKPVGPSPEELARELAETKARLESALGNQELPAGGEHLAVLEGDLAELKQRHAELEEQNNNLANLYVASYQLHSTLDFKEVISIVTEIVINLIGAETFCIMLIDGKTEELCVVTTEGMSRTPTTRIRVGDGTLGEAARTGQAFYRRADDGTETNFLNPIAAIPLKIKDYVIGLISVYSLFAQKDSFSKVDYELFGMLAGHAATAIFSAKLYNESERKLTTIQSFLDLLTTN